MTITPSSSFTSDTLVDPDNVWPVHVHVRVGRGSSTSFDTIRHQTSQFLEGLSYLQLSTVVKGWETNTTLRNSVEQIVVSEGGGPTSSLPIEQCYFQIHVYQASENSAYERLETNPSDSNEEHNTGTLSELPSRELEGLWESLFYDGDVKLNLLNYIYATVSFSDANVNLNLVSWNRVVLLHGPPGTGKTSLCRALAQQLSIRLRERYHKTLLFEINSHSLFSRWFSESGKLVQNLFSSVGDMASEEEDFVILLIDEVESLTSARSSAMAGNEPSDALRVVNALLTQIDRLKHRKNVLIMATSNLANAIDCAFVDRADVIQYIDYPPPRAIYEILRSSLVELMKRRIVEQLNVLDSEAAEGAYTLSRNVSASQFQPSPNGEQQNSAVAVLRALRSGVGIDGLALAQFVAAHLYGIAEKCKGVSGRSLRRLPVLAHSRYIGSMPLPERHRANGVSSTSGTSHSLPETVSIAVWLDAMRKVVDDQSATRQHFQ